MNIELVVFDMAGTTVADEGDVNRCFRETLLAADVCVTSEDVDEVMGLAKPEAIRRLLQACRDSAADWSPDEVERIHDAFVRRMLHHYATSTSVREVQGASHAFRRLHSMGISVALDTGFSRPIAETIVERLRWNDNGLVDALVTSDEVERGRPAPDMITLAMRRTGVRSASRVVKVGDTPADMQEGAAAGCSIVVAVANGSHTETQLCSEPCTHIVPSVALVPELIRRVEAHPPVPIALAWSL